MVALDIEMPESCNTCPLMRCGKCIANDSCKVDVTKPNNCPLHSLIPHTPFEPVVNVDQNIPKNVKLKFKFSFCEMCSNCDPVITTTHVDDLYCQECDIHKLSCSHEGACNYILNQRKEIRDV